MDSASSQIIEFTLIYNKYKTRLYNYILKLCGNEMTTEDIIHSAFLKLFENLDTVRNKESVNYWLFSTSRNLLFDLFRKKKKQYENSIDDDFDLQSDDDIAAEYEHKELREIINIELNKLNNGMKDIYLLREYGGLSYREIASVLNLDEPTVKNRLFKVRQKLIKKIEKLI